MRLCLFFAIFTTENLALYLNHHPNYLPFPKLFLYLLTTFSLSLWLYFPIRKWEEKNKIHLPILPIYAAANILAFLLYGLNPSHLPNSQNLALLLSYLMIASSLFLFWEPAQTILLLLSLCLAGLSSQPQWKTYLPFLTLTLLTLTLQRNIAYTKLFPNHSPNLTQPSINITIVFTLLLLGTSSWLLHSTQKQLPQPSPQPSLHNSNSSKKTQQSLFLHNTPKNVPNTYHNPNTVPVPTQIQFNQDLRFQSKNPNQLQCKVIAKVRLNPRAYTLLKKYTNGIFWKTGNLDAYSASKNQWHVSNPQRKIKRASPKQPYIRLSPSLPKTIPHLRVGQSFQIAPQNDPRIFYLGTPEILYLPSVWIDGQKNLFVRTKKKKLHYKIISQVPLLLHTKRWKASTTQYPTFPHFQKYLQLAKKITQPYDSDFHKIQAVEQYLKQNYLYQILPPATHGDSTYKFLFETKIGYCQHFASAMTLLLRSLGFQSRIAVGFRQGTWNPQKSTFTLTNLDAHSWVEVHFQNIGWIPFNPVAPADKPLEENAKEKKQKSAKLPLPQNQPITPPGATPPPQTSPQPQKHKKTPPTPKHKQPPTTNNPTPNQIKPQNHPSKHKIKSPNSPHPTPPNTTQNHPNSTLPQQSSPNHNKPRLSTSHQPNPSQNSNQKTKKKKKKSHKKQTKQKKKKKAKQTTTSPPIPSTTTNASKYTTKSIQLVLKNLSLLLALLTTLYLLRKKIYPSLKKLLSYLLHYLKQFLKQKQTLHHPHQPSTKSQKPSPTPHHSSLRQKAILAYLHYLNFLKKIGQPLPNYLTPEEHLQTTEKQKKRKQPHLQELVKIFLKARYSLEPISEAEAQKAEICSRWLQQNLKSTN